MTPAVDFSRRSTLSELMDSDTTDFETFRDCLVDLAKVNALTFAYRPTLRFLDGLADTGRLSLERPVTILDAGSGYGDMLRKVSRWAKRRGIPAALTGIDLNPWSARAAKAATEQDLERERSERARLASRSAAASDDVAAQRTAVSELEARLAAQSERAGELERLLAGGREQISAERRRWADLARSLVSEQERALSLQARVAALEKERDAKAAQAERATGERDALRAKIAQAREGSRQRGASSHDRTAYGRSGGPAGGRPAAHPSRTSARSYLTGPSSWSYVQLSGSRSVRQRRNWPV